VGSAHASAAAHSTVRDATAPTQNAVSARPTMRGILRPVGETLILGLVVLAAVLLLVGSPASGGAEPGPPGQGVGADVESQISWGSASGCVQNVKANDFGELVPQAGGALTSDFDATPATAASRDSAGDHVWVGCVTSNGPLLSVAAQGVQDMHDQSDILPLADVAIGVTNDPGGQAPADCAIKAEQQAAGSCTLPVDGATVRTLVGERPPGTTELNWQYQLNLPANQPPGSYAGGEVIFTATAGTPESEPAPENLTPPETSPQTPIQEQVLSTTEGTWSNSPTSFTYQWERCDESGENCTSISGATATLYTPVAADIGHRLRVKVTASNGGGQASATSVPGEPVQAAAPSDTLAPSISPAKPTEGTAEHLSTGTWTNSPTVFAYQWKRCDSDGENCTAITGATEADYTPVAQDVGGTLSATVTATNSGGSASADAPATEVVALSPPTAGTPLPLISGTAAQGHTLSSTTGTFGGGAISSYSYQWQDCEESGKDCTNITGATSSTYTLVSTDVAHTVLVEVTASNAAGSASETSQASVLIAGPPINTQRPALASFTPAVGVQDSATTGTWTESPSGFAYHWQLCNGSGEGCLDIAGAEASTYTPVSADAGHTLRVEVTATNEAGSGNAASEASTIIGESPHNVHPPLLSSEDAVEGQQLSVTSGTWAGTPEVFVYTYQWLRCNSAGEDCVEISGASSSTYTPVTADVSHTLIARVIASNTAGMTSAFSAKSNPVLSGVPVNTSLPSLTPATPQQGVSESSSNGTWTQSPTSYTYQWERCDGLGASCLPIASATSSTYTPTSEDVSNTLEIEVTATNSNGSSSASSAPSNVVVPPAPVNTVAPSYFPPTPQQGVSESVSTGTWSNSPTSFAYQWELCNASGGECSNIAGATSSSYTPVEGDVGHRLRAKVTATNAGGSASIAPATPVVVPPTPANSILPAISPSTPRQGTVESTTNGTWSNSPTSFFYQWQDCNSSGGGCSNISGATSSSYTPMAGDVGHRLRVEVTAIGAGGSATATSEATAIVLMALPVNTAAPTISSKSPTVAVAESTTTGTWSNSPTSYAYQWQDCDNAGESCTSISGATSSSYTPLASDAGHTLVVLVTASNAGGAGAPAVSANTSPVTQAPADSTPPELSTSSPTEGVALSVSNGTWNGYPAPSYTYQWLRCNAFAGECSEISGATSASYTPTAADVANTIEAVVKASNSVGNASATTSPSNIVTGAPANTAPPSLSTSSPVEGVALSVSNGTWNGYPTPTYSYQWQDCNSSGASCTNISAATSSSYTPIATDVGKTLRAKVTATNTVGTSSLSTTASNVVVPPAPVNTVAPSYFPPTPQQGVSESVSTGTWSNSPTSFAYQWELCNASGGECSNIAGATSSSYTPVEGDVGHRLRAKVTATNAGGSASSASVTPVVVPATPTNSTLPVISSSAPRQGVAESTTTGTWSNSPTSFTYQWQDCNGSGGGCSNISGATSSSYTPVPGDVGHTLRVEVTAVNAGGSGVATSAASGVVVPPAPVNSVLPVISPASPQQGVVESTTNGTWLNSPTSFTYQWQDCNASGESCANISGATSAAYTPVAGDVGHTLRVEVTAVNAGGPGVASSAASGVVVPLAPVNSVAPVISPSAPRQGVAESTTNGTWSNSPTSFTYQWQDCSASGESCANISGATSAAYTPVAGDVGHTLRVAVSATNAGGSSTATSAATAVVVPPAPVDSVLPVISPANPQQGVAESTTNGTWLNSPTSFSYQWQDCNASGESCSNISGATSASYTPVAGDVGHTLRMEITAVNAGGSGTATSTATAVVVPPAPVNSVLPVISPSTPVQGVGESTTTGTWSNSPTSFAYQWQDCNSSGASCTNISGATSSSYTPVEGDLGHTLIVKVTATNAGGSTTATSTATAVIVPPAPVNSVLPAISPTNPHQGTVESTTNGTWSNSPTSFTYQWQDCNSSGESCANISGATSSSYTPLASDVGDTLRAVITATNAGGHNAATSSASNVVIPLAPVNTVLPSISSSLPQQGTPLSTSNGTWSNSPTSFSYQWQRCNSSGTGCTSISGATSSTYTPVEADTEHTLIAEVTATNAGGSNTAAAAHSAVVLPPPGTITEYAIPSSSAPVGITTGSDNNLWFADSGSDSIGKITTAGVVSEVKLPAPFFCPNYIASGSDNNLWFTDDCDHQIGRITTAGTWTAFNLPTGSALQGITAGPDGNLWFAAEGTSKLGKITTAGSITEYAQSTEGDPIGIAKGPDGNLWFTSAATSKVGKITTAGSITEYAVAPGNTPYSIVAGPDGNLWFANYSSSKIDKISTSGTTINEFSLPANSFPRSITAGPDGNLWFLDEKTAKVGKITTAGVITEYALPSGSAPKVITVGPDRNLWFTEAAAIGKISPSAATGVPVNTVLPALSTSSPEAGVSLSTSNGTWSNSPTSFSYQWQDCNSTGQNCTNISAATSSTYTPVVADVGKRLRAVLTAANSSGSAVAASSVTNAVLLPPAPVNTAAPALSNESPLDGVSLSTSNGTWSNGPTSFTYQWLRCNSSGEGCVNISGATSASYTPVAADVNNTLKAQVTATNAGGSGTALTTASATVREIPSNTVLPALSTEAPEQNVQISVSSGTWNGVPASFTYAYQWFGCNSSGGGCLAISGATNSTYTPVLADVGSTLTVQVTATNTAGTSSPAQTAITNVVIAAPPPPANTELPTIAPSTPRQAVAESTTNGTWSNSPTSFAYQWEDCNSSGESCTTITGATSASYTPTASDVGHTLVVLVTATNVGGSNTAASAASGAVLPSVPVNTVAPAITPTSPTQGSVEITTNGTWTNSPTSFTRQWEDCNSLGESCTNIVGATASSYTPVAGDLGHTLRVRVIATNAGGSGTATSAATGVVVAHASHSQLVDSGNSLTAVSCTPATTDCVVGDSKGNTYYSTNVSVSTTATWKLWTGPVGESPVEALACPTTSLCVLADSGNVYWANTLGGTWTLAFEPSYGVDALSCASATFCVDGQGEGGGFIRYATSPASGLWTAEGIAPGGLNVTGVFCLTSSFCAAVDSGGNFHGATTTSQIESTAWASTNVNSSAALNSVACMSTTSCVATDATGDVLSLTVSGTGAATVVKHNIAGTASLPSIACTSTTNCVTVDSVGNVYISTNSGSTWTKQYALADKPTAVSCSTTSLCAETDTTGNVVTFEG
jgi:streptogramin lyase